MLDLRYNIIQTLAVLPAARKWHKEPSLIKWGDRKAKYSVWRWNKDQSETTKGTTPSKGEVEYLKENIGEAKT